MILNKVLESVGFDTRRIWIRWIAASEGKLFAQTVTEMVEEIRKLGPNPLKQMWDI